MIEELKNWLQQDTTKYFLKSLYNQREILKEELATINCQHGDFIRGKIKAIQSILETNPKEITEDFIDTIDKHYTKQIAVKAAAEEEEEDRVLQERTSQIFKNPRLKGI